MRRSEQQPVTTHLNDHMQLAGPVPRPQHAPTPGPDMHGLACYHGLSNRLDCAARCARRRITVGSESQRVAEHAFIHMIDMIYCKMYRPSHSERWHSVPPLRFVASALQSSVQS